MKPYKNACNIKIGDLCTDYHGFSFYVYRITKIIDMNRVRLEVIQYKLDKYTSPRPIYGDIYVNQLTPLTPTKTTNSHNHPLTKIFK